LERK
jgi:hypothetical protein